LGTKLSFKYLTYHILDHSPDELIAMKNPFSVIVLACQMALLEGHILDEELGEKRLAIAKTLLSQGYNHERIISLLVFLKNFIFIDNKDINSKFDKIIETLTGGTINMGIIETLKMQERREGKLEGKLEGEALGRHAEALEIAREMKKDKFPLETIVKLTKLTTKEIEAL
jgi:predicted transposase YdaD